jgi:hypothetical protein
MYFDGVHIDCAISDRNAIREVGNGKPAAGLSAASDHPRFEGGITGGHA